MTIEDCGVGSMKEECQIRSYGRATVGSSIPRTGLEQRGMKRICERRDEVARMMNFNGFLMPVYESP